MMAIQNRLRAIDRFAWPGLEYVLPDLSLRWDTATSGTTLRKNLKRLKLTPRAIQMIALGHGRKDHTGGMRRFLRTVDLSPKRREWRNPLPSGDFNRRREGHGVPVIVHPAAFRERRGAKTLDTMVGRELPPPEQLWLRIAPGELAEETGTAFPQCPDTILSIEAVDSSLTSRTKVL